MHINRSPKTTAIVTSLLFLVIGMLMPYIASAQQTGGDGDVETYVIDREPLDQARLDQLLAPIALYPDSLLSQILVAATYPLEVVQANRWRRANQSLTENQVLAAIEDKQWDPSVKALTPFTDLVARLSKDLDWLQQLGDAFLQNEDQVLASVQDLRQKARDNGSIADNDYYDVVEEDNNIIIKSTRRDIVYVPYYDSRVVYGAWGWNDYQPVYWNHPRHYRQHAGFYWSDRFYIRPTIFFGGFHWSSLNLVVNHHFYDRPYRHDNRYRNNRVSDYRHWNHNPRHRRGVRYSRNRENIRRNERNNVQRHEQSHRRDELRIERRDRDNSASRQQRRSNRVQRPTSPAADTTIVKNQQSYTRRINTNHSAARRQSASRAERNDANGNRSNSAANVRKAPTANNPPKRAATRQSNTRNNDNANNRSSVRNTAKPKPRHRTSNKRSHRQPN